MNYIRRISDPENRFEPVWIDFCNIAIVRETRKEIVLIWGDRLTGFKDSTVGGYSKAAWEAFWPAFMVCWTEYAADMQQRERMGA